MRQLSLHWGPTARVRIAHGVRAGEKALLEEVAELLAAAGERLSEPVLVVVPSAALRRHLLARILERAERGAVLGLDCRTHLGLAAGLVESGAPTGAALADVDPFALFARRLARREAALERSLEHLSDGYGAVVGAVRDLLDAGFDPGLAEALDEALMVEGRDAASDQELARARALVRVAAGTLEEMERWRVERSSHLLQRAAVLVRRRPRPIGRVLVYGFNDATGVATDFLLALLTTYGGSLYLDHPPDPAEPGRSDPGLAFSRSFRERIQASLPRVEELAADGPPARVETFRALGAAAEVREVAQLVRQLLAAGTPAERIGIVVRRLDGYVGPLREQLSRLAVPFSGDHPAGPFEPQATRVHAVLQLLREGSRAPVERWLDAATLTPSPSRRGDLLLALHTLGAGRLGEAAALDLGEIDRRGGLPLPVRRGFDELEDEPGSFRAARRWIGAKRLARAVAAAGELLAALEAWPARATAAEHGERLGQMLAAALGWPPGRPPWRDAHDQLRAALDGLPAALELDLEEVHLLLGRQLADHGRSELGGKGGGVQVLDATAARSLTFEHLFLLGLNRGVFPRQVREDPVLIDPLRQVLARSGFGVLPDLPVKRSGFHEERYLFAQLLSASPRVTLSWQEVDDQQKNLRAVSPLVERLVLAAAAAGDEIAQPVAKPVFSPGDEGAALPRPPYESAVLAGLAGDREALGALLELALRDGEEPNAAALAAARIAVLDEADPLVDRSPAALGRLGPWLGAVGAIAGDGDPRPRSQLAVTNLEKIAGCPWKHFLERVLKIERLPDPLEAVPGVRPQLVGLLVHAALEAVVEETLGEAAADWERALAAAGTPVPWPAPAALDEILRRQSRALVRSRHLGLPGLDRALVRAAAPHLETARRLDWPDGASRWPVVAAEIEGFLDLPGPGGARRILFRADRMDRTERGFSLTDYKTGRWAPRGSPTSSAGQRLLGGVRSGEWLQAAAYALAATERPGRGRYLYLSPLFDGDAGREYAVHRGQANLASAFERAVGAVLELWDRGAYFPRLVDHRDREPGLCSLCDVSDACVRGDSGVRRRLVRVLNEWREELESGADAAPHRRAIIAAWRLPEPPPKRKGKA